MTIARGRKRPSAIGLTISIAFVSVLATLAAAQRDLPVPKSTPSDHAVAISGCVHGTRLIPHSSSAATVAETLRASEFVLDGPKEILQMLRQEHNGHQEEIVGIAHLPPTPSDARAAVATVPVGKKARVTLGKRQEAGGFRPGPQPVRLTVKSVRHISDNCATRRS